MSPGILGKKIGMTQLFRPDGQVVPVTLLKAGPCMVVQRKTPTTDGYDAVQLGLLEFIKPQRINKPTAGRLKQARIDVPPGARIDRRIQLPFAGGARHAHGRTFGQCPDHGAQSRGDRSRHRGQRAGGEGRGSGSEWRIRAGAEVEEVTAMPTVDVVDLNNQKVSEVELADEVFGDRKSTRLNSSH